MKIEGIYPIVPTPFNHSGEVDVTGIKCLTLFMAQRGVQGLAVLGVLGEGHKLNERERTLVVRTFKDTLPKGLGLVVGVRALATDLAVAWAIEAQELGADALLVGPPPVQNDDTIFVYYQRVAAAVDIPIIIHDFPAETKILMSADLIARLFNECPHVEYIKLEDPPTGPKMAALQRNPGPGLKVFGALGGLFAFEELDRGAVGLMTGFAYPELLVELYRKYKIGDVDGAATLFYDILPLIRFEFQTGIGVSMRKHILVRRGAIKTAVVRHPGPQADEKTLEHLFRIVAHLEARGYDLQQ